MGALAVAKARIGEIVAQEYAWTRRGRRRKAAARFLGRERAESDGAPVPLSAGAGEEAPDDASRPSRDETSAVWDIAAVLAEPGWGVEYDLPRADGRAPWR